MKRIRQQSQREIRSKHVSTGNEINLSYEYEIRQNKELKIFIPIEPGKSTTNTTTRSKKNKMHDQLYIPNIEPILDTKLLRSWHQIKTIFHSI